MPQCTMCFQYKDNLVPVHPEIPAEVCRACAYKVSAVTGFLEFQGLKMVMSRQLKLNFEGEKPPEAPESIYDGEITDLKVEDSKGRKK